MTPIRITLVWEYLVNGKRVYTSAPVFLQLDPEAILYPPDGVPTPVTDGLTYTFTQELTFTQETR